MAPGMPDPVHTAMSRPPQAVGKTKAAMTPGARGRAPIYRRDRNALPLSFYSVVGP
jgi:hypothetical protein